MIRAALVVFFAVILSIYCISKFGWRYAGIKELDALDARVSRLEKIVFVEQVKHMKRGDKIDFRSMTIISPRRKTRAVWA